MVVSKTTQKIKMLKILKEKKEKYGKEANILCSICRKPIEKQEIENLQFEYCKSKISENYAHTKCVNQMINK